MSGIRELIEEFDEYKTKELYISCILKIIEGLRTAEKLWAAFSPVTDNFYIDIFKGEKAAAFIFSDEEYYNVYEDRLVSSAHISTDTGARTASTSEPFYKA